jgi:hypothetical protein
MPGTMTGVDGFRKTTNQASIVAIFQFAMVTRVDKARVLRNPLVHFRAPGHADLPVSRALRSGSHTYKVVESDAKLVLDAMFRLVAMNALSTRTERRGPEL